MSKGAPHRVRAQEVITKEELKSLGKTLRVFKVSYETRVLLAKKAAQPPPIRLKTNLESTLGRMAQGEVKSVLTDALAPAERRALVELDLKQLPTEMREIAHGLLNIHERWLVMKSMRRSFDQTRICQGDFLVVADTQPKEDDA